ncbi:MAG: DUF202 domain-containing protein [Propionibacteriales bacterium]|nr:DUF202 domain-containing protein [Propionibacteriales bacterium]
MPAPDTPAQPPPTPRRPRRVYDVGVDAEARDSLANERTFLAWVRTSLALVAGAVAVASPALEFSTTARVLLSLGLLTVSAAALGVGWQRWTRMEIALRTGGPRPGFTGGLVFLLALGILLAAALTAGFLGR